MFLTNLDKEKKLCDLKQINKTQKLRQKQALKITSYYFNPHKRSEGVKLYVINSIIFDNYTAVSLILCPIKVPTKIPQHKLCYL